MALVLWTEGGEVFLKFTQDDAIQMASESDTWGNESQVL